MDKNDAIRISKNYLQRLQDSDISFVEAWLFGSFAKGTYDENSDIDIAIVLGNNIEQSFDTEVKLMITKRVKSTVY